MLQAEWVILLVVGGIFVVLGIGAIIWDKLERKGYYEAMSHQRDVREYLSHDPGRPEFGALKTGGWIAIVIGIALLAMGGYFYYRG